MKFTSIVCAAVSFCVTSQVHAYGVEGHALIADMAQANLMPAAKAEVLRLLAGIR